jgi:hypothetical protein
MLLRLPQQIAAHALRRVVERQHRGVHLSGPEQAHEPVAQVFALQQHENDEHDDDRCRADGCDERAEDAAHDLHRVRRRLDDLHHRNTRRIYLAGGRLL